MPSSGYGCWKTPNENPRGDFRVSGRIDFLYKVNNDLPAGIGSRVAVNGGATRQWMPAAARNALSGLGKRLSTAEAGKKCPPGHRIEEAMKKGLNSFSSWLRYCCRKWPC
jgi:hypothetical protein